MPSFFDFLDQEAPQEAPAPAPIFPTIRPGKKPEDIQQARAKIAEFLKEATDYEDLAGGLQAGRVPTIQKRATVPEMRQKGNIQPGPLDELKETFFPSGATEELTDMVPTGEDPRRHEYFRLAKNNRARAEKLAREHGLDMKEFAPPAPTPEIKGVPGSIQSMPRPSIGGQQADPNAIVRGTVDTPEEVMKAHGVPVDEQYRALNEMAQQFGVSPDEPVNFGVAMSRVLSDPSNADLRSEFEGFFKRLGASGQQLPAAPGGPAGQQAQGPSASQIEEQNLQADIKELGKLAELQDWGSVLSFVLLSMLIGPQLAFLFYSNAAKKGTLREQIATRKDNIKRFQEREDLEERRKYDQENFLRELAAKSSVRGQEQKVEFRQRLYIHATESANRALEKAQQEGNPEKEQFIKDKKAQFNRALALAKATGMPAFGDDAPKFLDLAKSLSKELDILSGVAAEEEDEDGSE